MRATHSIKRPHRSEGEGAFRAMTKALERASLTPSDIDYINVHGTGTPNNDASECRALQRIFANAMPPISSTKSMTGHTTSASGGYRSGNLPFGHSEQVHSAYTPLANADAGRHYTRDENHPQPTLTARSLQLVRVRWQRYFTHSLRL